MVSSGSVFSETLQTITTTKLEELTKQRDSFEKGYAALLTAATAVTDPLARLFLLVDGAKGCLGIKTIFIKNKEIGRFGRVAIGGTSNTRLETDLSNIDRFLEQARYDPSVSPKVLQDWEKSILQYLSVQSAKYKYADLYGKLVTEWLSSEKTSPDGTDGDVEMAEGFEELPAAKKLIARTEWEKSVFEPANIDIRGLNDYLDNLFVTNKKGVAAAVNNLRKKVEEFENQLGRSSPFSVTILRGVIQGLQSSDLLPNEKREVLKDFLTNDIILAEVADVLNMRMAALDRWSWGDHVPVEQRRKLNGNYSIHMDEDLLQAMFLHYIGTKWSVFFKRALEALCADVAVWKSNQATVPKIDRNRRSYYLGSAGIRTSPNVQELRRGTHLSKYFVRQLLDYENQQIEVQEGEEEAAFDDFVQDAKRKRIDVPATRERDRAKQTARRSVPQPMMAQARAMSMSYQKVSADGFVDEDYSEESYNPDRKPQPKKPMEDKQGLLHILSTEIVVNTRLHGELTCFRSAFESWNPLLPHESILTVLTFFGVSETWTRFFKTFLEAPLKFTDDKSAAPRPRRRGTPGSHALSDVFGEVVFFCMDFSVNQTTDGAMLYRMYEEFWFWSSDYEKCVKAWASILQFTKATGTKLNENKTGSVRIARGDVELQIDDRLPEGEIRWGFLYLDPTKGTFDIDQNMVESHVEELRKQLAGNSKSVIDWIQTWNSYAATFFSSNFGNAANCFGREHVDKMLSTHRHIQESIFKGGNVVQFLKETIQERFSVDDIPDGFLFFPVELGGLDLKSPFVGLLQIRESVKENPHHLIDDFEEAERDDYEKAKRQFDIGQIKNRRHITEDPEWKPDSAEADTFFSFEEYIRFREQFCTTGTANLVNTYMDLLRRPVEQSIDVTFQITQTITQMRGQNNLKGITSDWHSMEPYWKWIAQMYGPEMIEKFGGLNIVDPGLLPIGMVSMFRQRRTKWQG
jgi:hypothetical protein